MQFRNRFEHTGCIAEHNLHIVGIDDTHDAVASGLRFTGDDADSFAH